MKHILKAEHNLKDSQQRFEFGHFVDRVFWFALTSAAIYSASQIKEMGRSIEELNKSMAVVLYQTTESRARADRIDTRIDKLEELVRKVR